MRTPGWSRDLPRGSTTQVACGSRGLHVVHHVPNRVVQYAVGRWCRVRGLSALARGNHRRSSCGRGRGRLRQQQLPRGPVLCGGLVRVLLVHRARYTRRPRVRHVRPHCARPGAVRRAHQQRDDATGALPHGAGTCGSCGAPLRWHQRVVLPAAADGRRRGPLQRLPRGDGLRRGRRAPSVLQVQLCGVPALARRVRALCSRVYVCYCWIRYLRAVLSRDLLWCGWELRVHALRERVRFGTRCSGVLRLRRWFVRPGRRVCALPRRSLLRVRCRARVTLLMTAC